MKRIYLDYAATTPVRKEVLEAMTPYFDKIFANPASIHFDGQLASRSINDSREKIRRILGANYSEEIIFTSSATESNNLAIKGLIFNFYQQNFFQETKPHIISSTIEHSSVLEVLKDLEKLSLVEVSLIKPEINGLINPQKIEKAIKENTLLVTLHYINSETGVRQEIEKVGKIIQDINNHEKKSLRFKKIYFHTDAAQAGLEKFKLNDLKVDLFTLSSHKIYGPKGIALLYVKKNTPLTRIISGSEEEFGLRGGTLNTPLIVGFAKTLELIDIERDEINDHLLFLRNYFFDKIKAMFDVVQLNSELSISSPKILNIYVKNRESQDLLIYLDQLGISVSQGSACKAKTPEPSYVITEIFDLKRAKQSIRISFGKNTTKEEINYLVDNLYKFVYNKNN